MNKSFLSLKTLVALLIPVAVLAADRPKEILLWPQGAPGSEGKVATETVRITPGNEHVISGVHQPSIAPYIPRPRLATGAAVIVTPGGGHRELWVDHEGYFVAEWLRDHGIAAFVLKYRLARETNSTYQVDVHALADAQRAIRLIRSRAQEWHVDPARVGILGFSAGGEVAALAALRFDQTNSPADAIDRENARPDFQALIYPGRSGRIEPTSNSPPAFLACGYKDRADISEGLANVYLKFKQVNVPAELHIYSSANHGFGLRPTNDAPVGKWIVRFEEWLGDSGFLKKQ